MATGRTGEGGATRHRSIVPQSDRGVGSRIPGFIMDRTRTKQVALIYPIVGLISPCFREGFSYEGHNLERRRKQPENTASRL